jgi:hypothetical protein
MKYLTQTFLRSYERNGRLDPIVGGSTWIPELYGYLIGYMQDMDSNGSTQYTKYQYQVWELK